MNEIEQTRAEIKKHLTYQIDVFNNNSIFENIAQVYESGQKMVAAMEKLTALVEKDSSQLSEEDVNLFGYASLVTTILTDKVKHIAAEKSAEHGLPDLEAAEQKPET